MDLRPFEAFAATHHSLLNKTTAIQLGVSRATWYRAIDHGLFEQIHPNVVRMIGSPRTRQQAILAAVWAADDAQASHRSGAFLWGVERPEEDPIDLILGSRSREASLRGVVAHRPRDRKELRPVIRQGIPCVNPMRVLVDLGAVDPGGVLPALEQLITSRAVSYATIIGALRRHAKRGHHGIGALRAALDAWQINGLPPDTKLELRMNEVIVAYGLPPTQFHAIVGGFEVDFHVLGTNIVLECDGWETHGLDKEQFEYDRYRNGELTSKGYVIVHFTWTQITREPAKVAARIRTNIARWAPGLLSA